MLLVAKEKPADAGSEGKGPDEGAGGPQRLLLGERTLTFIMDIMDPRAAPIVPVVAPNQGGICGIIVLGHMSKLHRVCRGCRYAEL